MAEPMAVAGASRTRRFLLKSWVPAHGGARTGAGEKPGRAFLFFFPPQLRQLHPGNPTFHTAELSVSPRKPFPDENQSVEPSTLPDSACGRPRAPAACTWRAQPSSTQPSYRLASTLKVLRSLKKKKNSAALTSSSGGYYGYQRGGCAVFVLVFLSQVRRVLIGGRPSDLVGHQVGDRTDEGGRQRGLTGRASFLPP